MGAELIPFVPRQRPLYYTLDENMNAVPADAAAAERMFSDPRRYVGNDAVWLRYSWFQRIIIAVTDPIARRFYGRCFERGAQVSTVFLGIDHAFGDEPPMLFETMIFGGTHDGRQRRCSTYREALVMHRAAMKIAGDV